MIIANFKVPPRTTSLSPEAHAPSPQPPTLASPPGTPPRVNRAVHRPSPSNPIISLSKLKPTPWLTRSNTSASSQPAPYTAASKPVRISEPKIANSLEAFAAARGRVQPGNPTENTTEQDNLPRGLCAVIDEQDERRALEGEIRTALPSGPLSPPTSPPVPYLLASLQERRLDMTSPSPTYLVQRTSPSPPAPLATAPPLQSRSSICSRSPLVPRHSFTPDIVIEDSQAQPSFHAVFLSGIPTGTNLDPSKTVVTLETCTTTHRTTLRTLYSRPSNLSRFILSSIYSDPETEPSYVEFASAEDLLSSLHPNLHIFLDRPSSPYSHILAYLRLVESEKRINPLPRSLLFGSSASVLGGLLELRDEALYLGLDELHEACDIELRKRQSKQSDNRCVSSASGLSSVSLPALSALQRLDSKASSEDNRYLGHQSGTSLSARAFQSSAHAPGVHVDSRCHTPASMTGGIGSLQKGHAPGRPSLSRNRPVVQANPPPGWI